MERMAPRGDTPRASDGLSRPIAKENSPICGIVMPTRNESPGTAPGQNGPDGIGRDFPTHEHSHHHQSRDDEINQRPVVNEHPYGQEKKALRTYP